MSKNYKAVFAPRLGCPVDYEQEHETHEEAIAALNTIANYTLFLHKNGLMTDHSNIGMVMKRDGDDWHEIDNDGWEI